MGLVCPSPQSSLRLDLGSFDYGPCSRWMQKLSKSGVRCGVPKMRRVKVSRTANPSSPFGTKEISHQPPMRLRDEKGRWIWYTPTPWMTAVVSHEHHMCHRRQYPTRPPRPRGNEKICRLESDCCIIVVEHVEKYVAPRIDMTSVFYHVDGVIHSKSKYLVLQPSKAKLLLSVLCCSRSRAVFRKYELGRYVIESVPSNIDEVKLPLHFL